MNMGTASIRVRFVSSVAAGIVLSLLAVRARAEGTWDPTWSARMAITDRSTAADIQPYVWMNAQGKLVYKDPDATSFPWVQPVAAITGVNSGVGAVSWKDGAVARQRVYYTRGNKLSVLNYDDNVASETQLTQANGYLFANTAISAVRWKNGNTETIGVAVGGKVNTTAAYHVCVYEGAWNQTPTAWCTAGEVLPAVGDHDIASVSLGGTARPEFFFVTTSGLLRALIPSGTSSYSYTALNRPTSDPLRGTIFATETEAGGAFQIGVISYNETTDFAWIGTVAANSASVTWTALPTLPNNIAVLNQNTIGGITYTNNGTHTLFEIVSWDSNVYRITSTDGVWPTSWQSPLLPGGGMYLRSLGAITKLPSQLPRTFFVAGNTSPGDGWTNSLSELQEPGAPFRDHIRLDLGHGHALSVSANEPSGAVGPSRGLSAATQRNNPPPWTQVLSQTTNAASSWGSAVTVSFLPPINSGYSTAGTDPVTAVGGGVGNGLMHFSNLELDINSSCDEPSGTTVDSRIVLRRDTSASVIASKTLSSSGIWVMDQDYDLDHPGLGITYNPYDPLGSYPTAHVVWTKVSGTPVQRYATVNPTNVKSSILNITSRLPAGPAGVAVGAGPTAYGWTTSRYLCKLTPGSLPTSADCGVASGSTPVKTIGGATLNPPMLNTGTDYLYFGTSQASQQGDCPVAGDGNFYKCFVGSDNFIQFTVDPVTTKTFYAVYLAKDQREATPTHLALYFTKNTGQTYTTWSTPVVITPRLGNENYFDPAITVDANGTIVITYSRMTSSPDGDTSGSASGRAHWCNINDSSCTNTSDWTDGGTFSVWNAKSLPFHCRRQWWWLSDYHYGSVMGGRAYHLLPSSGTSAPTKQMGHLYSRWSM
jgi:hypothetical protein